MKKVLAISLLLLIIFLATFIFLSWQRRQPGSDTSFGNCPKCRSVLPDANFLRTHFGRLKIFEGYKTQDANGRKDLVGFAFASKDILPDERGYAGPIELMIGLDPGGNILAVSCLSQSETPVYMEKLPEFLKQFTRKSFQSPLIIGRDIDGITGATITSEAVARIVRESVKAAWQDIQGESLSAQKTPLETSHYPATTKLKSQLTAAGLVPREAKYWETTEP